MKKEKLNALLIESRNSLNEDNLLMDIDNSFEDDEDNEDNDSEKFMNFDESDLLNNFSNSEINIEETKMEFDINNSNFEKKNNYKKESIYMQVNQSPQIKNFLNKVSNKKSEDLLDINFYEDSLKQSYLLFSNNNSGSVFIIDW